MGDRLVDIPVYVAVVGLIELVCLLLMAVGAVLLVPGRGWQWYRRAIGRAARFGSVLLVFGCIGNSVFMLIAYDRMYVSADTVVDFFPFVPFGQWVLDQQFGPQRGRLLNGATLWQLRALWFAIAAPVWAATIAFCRGYVHESGAAAPSR